MNKPWLPGVGVADRDDAARCIDTLCLAFAADPAARWLYPQAHRYLASFPGFAHCFGSLAFDEGTALVTEGHAAVALWLPPGVGPDEAALLAHLADTVEAERQPAAFAAFEQMGGYHPPEPHWYLPLIGTDAAMQGRGHGSRLLVPVLARCDADGLPAYLESSNPRNIPFYVRHGFHVLGTIAIHDGPPITPMLREPRRA